VSGCGFEPRRCILDGVSKASYYIGKREIKVAKWGIQKKERKKTNSHKGIFATNSNIQKDKSNKKQLGQK
jgi:hypothetical protein